MNSCNEMQESIKDSVDFIARAKTYVDSLPVQLQNEDYNTIVTKINEYLKKYCVHRIVTDSIDIDYDRSQTIRYCECCFQTFELDDK